MIKVANINKGESYTVYIGRSGKGRASIFGNPFSVKTYGLLKCLQLYEALIKNRIKTEKGFKEKLLALDGETLGCFCKPRACHGDILVKLVNELKAENCTCQ